MGIMAYSLLWVMQDLYHQPYLTQPCTLKRSSWPQCSNPVSLEDLKDEDAWLRVEAFSFRAEGFRVVGQ